MNTYGGTQARHLHQDAGLLWAQLWEAAPPSQPSPQLVNVVAGPAAEVAQRLQ